MLWQLGLKLNEWKYIIGLKHRDLLEVDSVRDEVIFKLIMMGLSGFG